MTDWPDETNARLAEIAASAPPGLTEAQISWLIVAMERRGNAGL